MGVPCRVLLASFLYHLFVSEAVAADGPWVEQLMNQPMSTTTDPASSCYQPYCRPRPFVRIGGTALFSTRSNSSISSADVLTGPDARVFDLSAQDQTATGYRIWTAASTADWEFESIYSHYGDWSHRNTGTLTAGIGFDDGILPGSPFSAQNAIRANSIFAPINGTASFNGVPNETDEFEGLGPINGGPTAPPAYLQQYDSRFKTWELNVLFRDYLMGHFRTGGYRLGMGYVNADLDEQYAVSLTGTFLAPNNLGNGGGLYNGAFLAPTGGDLQLLGGNPNGFSDNSGQHLQDTNNLVSDTLVFAHTAAVGNRMNGVQFIYDAIAYDSQFLTLSAVLKAGMYQNEITGTLNQRYSDEDSVYGRSLTDKDHTLSLMGSIGVNGKVHIYQWLSLYGGYDLNFMNGVALAPDQRITGGTYEVDAEGDLLFHTARIGAELTF